MRIRTAAIAVALLCLAAGLAFVPARAGGDTQTFISGCSTAKVDQVDPIVSPGMRMSAHMHQFFGNTSIDQDSTYRSMTADGDTTTCSLAGDTAAYWIPELTAPDGTMVEAQQINAYYRAVGKLARQHVSAYPPDLRMVSHNYFYSCGGGAANGTPTPGDCGSAFLHVFVVFPACWDGTSTDSPDHISHMAFQTGRGCPADHPVAVPRLVVIARYPDIHDATGYAPISGDATTMHADFWNTWDQNSLQHLVDACINDTSARCGDTPV